MHYKQIISFFLQFDTNQLWGINILNFEVLLAYLLVWFSDMIPLSFRFKSYTLVGQCLVDLMKQFLASLSSWGSCVFLSSSSELGGPMTLFFGHRRNLKIMITKENTKTIIYVFGLLIQRLSILLWEWVHNILHALHFEHHFIMVEMFYLLDVLGPWHVCFCFSCILTAIKSHNCTEDNLEI